MTQVPFGRRQRARLLATAAAGALALSAGPAAASNHPTIKLGQIAPFTGSAAEFGEFYRDGAALAVQHINTAAEDVLGGPVIGEHLAEDTNTLPTPAIEAARRLVEAEGVPAIVGAWSSGVTTSVAASVTIDAGVLQISNGSTSPLISVLPEDEGNDLLFRTTASDALQGVVAAQLAAGEIVDGYSFDSASTIYVNNPYGQGLSNAFARSFQLRGGTVHAQVPHPEETQPTYSSQLASALQNDPEMLFAASYPAHTASFMQEANELFDVGQTQFVDGNKSDQVIEAVGADNLEGMLGTAPGQNEDSAGFQNFEEAYLGEFDHDRIPPFTTSAYDAALTIGLATVQAIADGHDSRSDITGEVLRDRLRDVSNLPGDTVATAGDVDSIAAAMEAIMDGGDVAYDGAAGPTDFDDNGDVVVPIEIWEFTGGETETVELRTPDQIPSE